MGSFIDDFNSGLSAARGIIGAFEQGQQIAARRRQAEKEQDEKDSFAAAELLGKIEAAESNPDELRQLHNQFNGYTPRAKYHAMGLHIARKQMDQDAVKLNFQKDYDAAVGELQKAKVYFQQGRTLDGMKSLNSILNNQLRDGNTYDIVQDKGGGFRQIVRDRHGNEISSSPVTPDEMYTQYVTLLRDPGKAFNAYTEALSRAKLENFREYDEFKPEHTYVDPKTGAKFHRKRFLDWRTNTIREHWFNDEYKEVPPPDLSRLKNLKQQMAERDDAYRETSQQLDIEGKREAIRNQRKYGVRLDKVTSEEEKESDIRRYETEMMRHLAAPYWAEGKEVDEKKLVVYTVAEDEFGKAVKRIDPEATKKLRQKAEESDRFVRENRRAGESRYEAFLRLTDESKARRREAKASPEGTVQTQAPAGAGDTGVPAPPRGVPDVSRDEPGFWERAASKLGSLTENYESPDLEFDSDAGPQATQDSDVNLGGISGGIKELIRKRKEAVRQSYVK